MRLFRLSILIFALFVGVCHTREVAGREGKCETMRPLVLLPGIAGSILNAKFELPASEVLPHWYCKHSSGGKFEMAWLHIFPEYIHCFLHYLTGVWDDSAKMMVDRPGVEVEPDNFGGVSAMDTLDPTFPWSEESRYFHGFIQDMEQAGYVVNKTMFGAPYDWRHLPNQGYFEKLKALIEHAYEVNGDLSVELISHSMGGNFGYVFLSQMDQAWKDKYVHHWIAVSSPWIGATVATRSILSGNDLGILTTSDASTRDLCRASEAIYLLAPHGKFWNASYNIVETPSAEYSVTDFPEMMSKAGVSHWDDIVSRAHALYGDYEWPGVDFYYLYTTLDGKTEVSYTYSKDGMNCQPKIRYGAGDGTVDFPSLMYVSDKWQKEGHSVFVKGFPDCDHMDSISDERIVNVIQSIVCLS